MVDDLSSRVAGDGRRGHQRNVRGDAGACEVAETQSQVGELGDPGFGDRDDDAEPVLAGESLGEEHGAYLCRGCYVFTVPGRAR